MNENKQKEKKQKKIKQEFSTENDIHILDMSEIHFDDDNANMGTEKGDRVLEKSLRKLGFGRSVLLDKDNRVIAGNHVLQKSAELGLNQKIVTVDVDGDTIVAVRRTDMSIDSKEGRMMAIADNHTAVIGIDLSEEVMMRQADEYDFSLSEEFEIYPQDETDFSGKNQEVDTESFEDKCTITLSYTLDEYDQVKTALHNIASTPEDAIWKLLKLDK